MADTKLVWTTQKRKINDLIPYEHNPRKLTEEQAKQLKKSIEKFGLVEIPVIDTDNLLVAGHQRCAMMQLLGRGEEEVDVRVPNRKLTEEEMKEYNVRSNKNTGEWDFSELANLFDESELRDFGFSDLELGLMVFDDEKDEKEDDVPEAPETPKSALGDLYELDGGHRILCWDSTNLEAILRLCGDSKVDMYLTDPPYNVALGMNETPEEAKKRNRRTDGLVVSNDSMGDTDFRKFLVDAFTTADAVMKKGAVFYIWHADSEGYNFRGACHDIGWTVRQCLIWAKSTMVMGRQDYQWKHEPCLYGWKEGASHLWNSDRTQTTLLSFDKPSRNKEHPTMKPVELFSYQLTNNTKGEDIVLDTFLGSGTTLIAAHKKGRKCYGCELDPKYVDVIIQRYVDYTGNTKIKKNGKEITWIKNES